MKNTHICPKCKSDIIVKVPDSVGDNIIVVKKFGKVKLTRYVCCSCGFAEEWVDDKAELEKVESKWKQVNYGD